MLPISSGPEQNTSTTVVNIFNNKYHDGSKGNIISLCKLKVSREITIQQAQNPATDKAQAYGDHVSGLTILFHYFKENDNTFRFTRHVSKETFVIFS